jgi:hypothetical protein
MSGKRWALSPQTNLFFEFVWEMHAHSLSCNPPGGKDCVTKYDLQMKPNRYLTVTVALFSACFFPCPGDADRQSTSNPSGRCGDQLMLCFARANSAEFEGLFYSGMTSIALTDGWFGSQQE